MNVHSQKMFKTNHIIHSGDNFIKVKCTNCLYKRRFGSFYYVHVTGKKAVEKMFVRKICTFNVDEIDYR